MSPKFRLYTIAFYLLKGILISSLTTLTSTPETIRQLHNSNVLVHHKICICITNHVQEFYIIRPMLCEYHPGTPDQSHGAY